MYALLCVRKHFSTIFFVLFKFTNSKYKRFKYSPADSTPSLKPVGPNQNAVARTHIFICRRFKNVNAMLALDFLAGGNLKKLGPLELRALLLVYQTCIIFLNSLVANIIII